MRLKIAVLILGLLALFYVVNGVAVSSQTSLQSAGESGHLSVIAVVGLIENYIDGIDLGMAPDDGFYGLFVIGVVGLIYRTHRRVAPGNGN